MGRFASGCARILPTGTLRVVLDADHLEVVALAGNYLADTDDHPAGVRVLRCV